MTRPNTTDAQSTAPEEFQEAIASLTHVTVRPEVTLEPIRAPQRLAPYSHALGAEVFVDPQAEAAEATGRLVVLHDPDGHEAWDGTLRIVSYISASMEADIAGDPALSDVSWTWLTDALEQAGAEYTALGGTVTRTSSTRYGDLAGAEASKEATNDLEMRASWTARSTDLSGHLRAWVDLLASAAGAPPPGVSMISNRTSSST